jgi:predicted GNAT family acetyltransferase
MVATPVGDADTFLTRAGAFLAAHEAEHNLPLGLLGRLRVEPRLYGFDPTFVVAEDGDSVVGCLLRTPPHGVVLSRFESLEAVDPVAEAVLDMHPGLPGAVGPNDVVARFAATWSRLTGVEARIVIRQRVHAAAAVGVVPVAPGRMREACLGDIPIILDWLRAFAAEALGDAPHVEDVEETYRRREADPDGAWLLWDDGGPVSLAAYGTPTPTGTRVGPVYTPPEHRGRGYATSLVAELTAERLASGLAFCFLFTDLANPTSNAIYARIGYEPVADWDQWAFSPLEEQTPALAPRAR